MTLVSGGSCMREREKKKKKRESEAVHEQESCALLRLETSA